MKRQIIIIFILILFPCWISASESLSPFEEKSIMAIIDTFKKGNKTEIAKQFFYPIKMNYPNPDIPNEDEFFIRFDEVLDDKIIKRISTSTVSNNWNKVGWRGIMFNNGDIWANGKNESENLKIIKINYQTEIQQSKNRKIIRSQKETIHPLLNHFKWPILDLNIGNFHIRIDQMNDFSFRYASWEKSKNPSQKPDLILLNGSLNYLGTRANHEYSFKNGNFLYKVSYLDDCIGCDELPYLPVWILEIFDKNQLIFRTFNKTTLKN